MSDLLFVALIFAILFLFLFTGTPVAFALISVSLIFGLIALGPPSLYLGYIATFSVISKEIYIAVPLFIFMAGVLEFSGVISNLYDTMYKLMGPLRGGLAIGSIVAAVMIAAMTGLGGTAVVTLGILALPEMFNRGYDRRLALGCIPAGGALGPVIPPSVVMIVLAGLTGLSPGRLFIGGVFPGLVVAGLWCTYIIIVCALKPSLAPALAPDDRASWGEKIKSLRKTIPSVALITLVLGSIYTGACTPTEAAGAGAVGAIVCAALNRRIDWQSVKQAAFRSVRVSCMVYFLLIGGTYFASIMATTGLSAVIRDTLVTNIENPLVLIALMQVVALLLGCFMDAVSNLMICVPVFWPVVIALPGIDPLWWGVVFTVTLCLGFITPPFGMNLFYLKGIVGEDISMGEIYRSTIPYCLIYILGIGICLLFPPIVTWLPKLMV